MNILYLRPEEQLIHEIAQSRDEGKSVEDIDRAWNSPATQGLDASLLRESALELLDKLRLRPEDPQLALEEPSDLGGIRGRSGIDALKMSGSPMIKEDVLDRIHGGWLGRAAGCLLGKPVEKAGRRGIREMLQAAKRWPLADYFSGFGVPSELLATYPWNRHGGWESLKENIKCMPEDDDLNYPIVNLIVAERFGSGFTSEQVAQTWLETLPALATYTAERVAYVNCLKQIPVPDTAIINNPYREWIGAQIRADLWGWIACGNPVVASEYAWRDARLSHVRNGIYGEMFFAAAIAEAGHCQDIEQILRTALMVVPAKSRFAQAVEFAMKTAHEQVAWENVVDRLERKFEKLYWVHTLNNASLVVAALIHGRGDFERTICAAVMGGWDADCNGATAGSVLGTMLGARRLPEKWIKPLNNCLRSSVAGFDNSAFDQLARRTCALQETFVTDRSK
jgi:ADP-ribosylglycohydrolase